MEPPHLTGTVFLDGFPNKAWVVDFWFFPKKKHGTNGSPTTPVVPIRICLPMIPAWHLPAAIITIGSITFWTQRKPVPLPVSVFFDGYTITVEHDYGEPLHHYAFQLGTDGANQFNQIYGLGGWFSYQGTADPSITTPTPIRFWIVGEEM